jgi:hypothetical protein
MMEDDLHDKLVKAYLDYFKAYEWYGRKHSVRAYAEIQKCTRKIRDLADQRNKEIRRTYKEIKKGRK